MATPSCVIWSYFYGCGYLPYRFQLEGIEKLFDRYQKISGATAAGSLDLKGSAGMPQLRPSSDEAAAASLCASTESAAQKCNFLEKRVF